MTLKEYRQRYADLYQKIQTAQKNLDIELMATKNAFDKLFCKRQEADRRWFAAHLDFFLKHRNHFQSDFSLSEIIIDFLKPCFYTGMVGCFAFTSGLNFKIRIKDLFPFWDEGFTYKGFPILQYEVYSHHGTLIKISYVKDGRIEVVSVKSRAGTENPLKLPDELLKKIGKSNIFPNYPDWQTYKTIDLVRNVLNKSERRKNAAG